MIKSPIPSTLPFAATSITVLSAGETAILIRRKQLSQVEVVKAYLTRIEEVEPKLNRLV
jgi:Asp-tRNA(Asn)/Glu-tRNA(Gln) amidotransferase A subunit family amidase